MTTYSGQILSPVPGFGEMSYLNGVSLTAGELLRYRNSVWDTQKSGSDKTHYWISEVEPDTNGFYYDGPGTWGTHTSGFSARQVRNEGDVILEPVVNSNLWAPPETPHVEDDEFDRNVLDSSWYSYSVPGGDYGTFDTGAVDIYDTTFNSGSALRANVNDDDRRSWALLQAPQSTFMLFGKTYTFPTNVLVMARLKFDQYTAAAVGGDRHIGLMFQEDNAGKPDWNNRMNMYLNLQSSGAVRASRFTTISGGDGNYNYTTDVDAKGQALEYVALHKLGSLMHGWVGTASGNWIWMGAVSMGGMTFAHVTLGLYTVSNDKPAVTVFGVDFVRFYETTNFLF